MLNRKVALLCALFSLLPGYEAFAQKRITDIGGRDVLIGSGARAMRPQTVKAASFHPHTATLVTVNAGPDTDAANNDYRRIQNALNAAGAGDTITLAGTFDFTAPFAAAAWAAGNDGIAGNSDDYEVSAPRGVNNVTLTATSLGSATIQGPGDLPALNLESFLVFDASLAPGGGNQGWTISNLRVLDFDLGIGMFAVGASDYNNTTITNNFIRIATDLNATVAPADTLQNIGLHFSFGTNQTISNNTFHVPGDGISAGANTSSTVVMQSNTSGGAVYNGLSITGNVTHVLNAQSANPQVTLGIWENGHAHTSNITISNNSFLNDAMGNNPALNLERGFRVTSHSGATSTVTYSGNTVTGANIGFQWITGSNFAGNLPVQLISNTIGNCDTGVLVQSNGIAHLETDVIIASGAGGGVHVVTGTLAAFGANPNGIDHSFVINGSGDGVLIDATAGAIAPLLYNDLSNNTGFGLNNLSAAPQIIAELNYWGNNLAANVAAEVNGNVDFDPWLASGQDNNGSIGYQPFVYATTTVSGNTTTLAGTGAADTGSMLAGNPILMTMDGGSGSVPLAQLLNVVIQLGGSDDLFTLGQTGVPTTFDGGAGNDTLIGTNVAQTWNITGAGSGNIPGAASAFSNVESLRGGLDADSFVFGAAGSVAQTIDGNIGIDTLDNTAIPGHTVTPTGPGTLDGFKGTASGVGTTFDNINIIGSPADLQVNKTGPATANAGVVISYTITVMNNGPNPAINATLTDATPAGTTFSSLVSPGGWSCSTPAINGTGTISCTMGSMAAGSAVFTLNVNGPATAPASVSNTASVSSSSTDNTPGNNNSTANTNVINTADLSITKTATPSAPQGTNVTYNISLTNNGPNPATSVSLSDALPANTTFVSEAQNTGPLFICSNPSVGTNGTVTCTLASMASGATATFTIVAAVSSSAPLGTLNNTAIATTTSTDPTTPNTSTAGTTITAGNTALTISKTPAPGPYGTGASLTYTIAVSNAGPSAAANVTVTDILPAGTTFGSATPSQGSCSGTTTVTCTLGTLASAGSASISLTVTLPATPGPVVNTATVTTSSPESNTLDNSSTSTITVVPNANIPATSPMVLLLLAFALSLAGFLALRK
ncbi:MAG: trimeric autotransporter adhesin [Thermoanaerobaculia bacterium]|jgi:uncharacterized repeat protein (TIGR01451 family)|nr:trimeric autotransporter adhesin [Thermoanaerobaculia bacterium]